MATMIKEEKYVVYVGTEEYVLHVQELVWGLEPWPERFRAQLPMSRDWTATVVYGSTGREAAERATQISELRYGSSYPSESRKALLKVGTQRGTGIILPSRRESMRL